jgi:hypothetical protein
MTAERVRVAKWVCLWLVLVVFVAGMAEGVARALGTA